MLTVLKGWIVVRESLFSMDSRKKMRVGAPSSTVSKRPSMLLLRIWESVNPTSPVVSHLPLSTKTLRSMLCFRLPSVIKYGSITFITRADKHCLSPNRICLASLLTVGGSPVTNVLPTFRRCLTSHYCLEEPMNASIRLPITVGICTIKVTSGLHRAAFYAVAR